MVRTRECDFCGDEIEAGTGTMFVRTDGATEYYCSSKCENAADLGREPRETGWTEAGREAAEANRREEGRRGEEVAEAEAEPEAAADEVAEADTDDTDEDAAEDAEAEVTEE